VGRGPVAGGPDRAGGGGDADASGHVLHADTVLDEGWTEAVSRVCRPGYGRHHFELAFDGAAA